MAEFLIYLAMFKLVMCWEESYQLGCDNEAE
jgi:hypothetical protein